MMRSRLIALLLACLTLLGACGDGDDNGDDNGDGGGGVEQEEGDD